MPTASSDPNMGRKLANRYELVERLGQGSMGNVYGARDHLLGGVSVAIKFLSQALLNDRMRERFEHEATICAMLGQRSIHIIRVTDYGIDEHEIPFYVMEYLKGDSLAGLIQQEGAMPIPRFLLLVRQICLGLQCAHKGINIEGQAYPVIHRDIKPSNIFITKDDSLGELVKVLDFGIAKMMQGGDADQTRTFMGTLAYASPEQMEGRELDIHSDLYSLGVLMFQMLTGRMPIHADTHTFGGWYKAHQEQVPRAFRAVRPDVQIPKLVEKVVMSCLSKDPSARPKKASDIIEALKPLDDRYSPGISLYRRLEGIVNNKPVRPRPKDTLSADEFCRAQTWPNNKPIAEIVFPTILRTSDEQLATLWIMLPKEAIDGLAFSIAYNKFMFMPTPHPVMLWVTVLYNQEYGARWFPCYLNLKNSSGQRTVRLLAEAKHYRLLFFAKENPQVCTRVMSLTITEPATLVRSDLVEKQSHHLLKCINLAQTAPSTQVNLSKPHLKAELEKMKPGILRKLEDIL
ncbi:MAG: serine/threonine-protein kinase [Elainellaceae cyanobacterium]